MVNNKKEEMDNCYNCNRNNHYSIGNKTIYYSISSPRIFFSHEKQVYY